MPSALIGRVLVTGSRDWPWPGTVHSALNYAFSQFAGLTVVHGACPVGGDRFAEEWVTLAQRAGLAVVSEPHPADWRRFGLAAGPRRNVTMVATGADLCLAFIMPCRSARCGRPQPHGSHGATHCAGLAEDAGIPTCRWTRP